MLLTDDVQAQIMESRDGQAASIGALDQLADSGLHLARGLVGKGDGDNMLRANAALFDQVGNLARDHTGFAATRASQHQQWTADVLDSFLLTGV